MDRREALFLLGRGLWGAAVAPAVPVSVSSTTVTVGSA